MNLEKNGKLYKKDFYMFFKNEVYPNYKDKLLDIIKFMEENKKIRIEHNKLYLSSLVYHCNHLNSANEIILEFFLNSLKTVPQGNMNNQFKCLKYFENIINKLNPNLNNKINFNKLFKNEKPFNYFKNSNFKGLGPKTTSLFLRDIYLYKDIIFEDANNFKESYLFIPVDIVICVMLNKLFNLNESKVRFIPERDFDFINIFFREKLGSTKFMIIEDLWFWGYFNLITNNKNKRGIREFKFNEAKFTIDIYSFSKKENTKKLLLEFQNKFWKYFNLK